MVIAKRIWSVLVALKDGLVLIAMLIFFGLLFMVLSSTEGPSPYDGGALIVDLDGVLVEQPEEIDPLALIQGAGPSFAQYRGRDVIRALNLAAKDDDITSVVLNLDGFMGGGQVLVQDVAAAIAKVKAAKKPVYAYSSGYYDDSYLMAAQASEIWLDPMGGALFQGPGGNNLYFKSLLERFGVNVRVFRVGKFKSFIEPFTRDGQSDESRAADKALVDDLWGDWKAQIKAARPNANFDAITQDPGAAAKGKGLAQLALDMKLVDKLGSETDFGQQVAKVAGAGEEEIPGDFRGVDFQSYLLANPESTSGEGVALVTIAGEIVDGEASAGMAGGDTVARHVREALSNDDVKALVVRIDSPGGSAFASEKMRLAMEEARKKKLPVIVSMGNLAASGGYWAAMAGDKVFAEPSTITGSIGVFSVFPTFENSLARYGVQSDGVKTTPLSGQPDIFGGLTPETDRLFQAGVEDIYGRFVGLVAKARKVPEARVSEIAEGRVWSGAAARQLGLVDAFGDLDAAIAEAAKRAKLDPTNVRIIEVTDGVDFLTWVLGGLGFVTTQSPDKGLTGLMAARQQALLFGQIRSAARISTGGAVQARCMSCPIGPTAPLPVAQTQNWLPGIFK
jgi:protease IV